MILYLCIENNYPLKRKLKKGRIIPNYFLLLMHQHPNRHLPTQS